MNILNQIDWKMLAFLGISLANEYLANIHFPKVYYWHSEGERLIKEEQNKDDHNKAA